MRVHLVRHGQTAWNLEGRAQGHSDQPLDPTGQDQTRHLAAHFERYALSGVWSSDLSRAADAAVAVAASNGLLTWQSPLLRERSFGAWEGDPFLVIRDKMERLAQEKSVELFDVRPPGGESMVDVFARIVPIKEKLDNEEGEICLVSHGGTCGILLASLLGADVSIARSFRFHNTAITTLERRADGFWTLLAYNQTPHLSESGTEMIDASAPIRR